MPEPVAEIIGCAGPPTCELSDQDAVDNQKAGCPKCLRIVVYDDGSETTYQMKAH